MQTHMSNLDKKIIESQAKSEQTNQELAKAENKLPSEDSLTQLIQTISTTLEKTLALQELDSIV